MTTTNHDTAAENWRAILSKPLSIDGFQSAAAGVEVEIAAASNAGKIPSHNTDHYLAVRMARSLETIITSLDAADLPPRFEEFAYAMLVADGLGDNDTGARASRAAVSALAHLAIRYGKWNIRVSAESAEDIRAQAEFFVRETHEAVIRDSKEDFRLADMATSLTAVYIAGTDLFFAHVGHSRAFLFRNGTLIPLTSDHTLEERPPDQPRAIRLTGRSMLDQEHVVTETIGGRSSGPNVEIEHLQLWSGDRVLLCTNGLTDVVSEDDIADILALRRTPQDDCARLVDLALMAGGPDNVTVVTADYRIRRQPKD
jgi:PPM family protein phosphatase